MKKSFGIVVTLLIGIALTLSGMSDADARRLGGGGSFGGKSLFGSSYKRTTAAPRTAKQQQATQHNQATKQSWAQRGGFMGMLGGLAIGGLLGSLLFGGAFENLNFMDLLIFGGIAYMLYRFLGARAAAGTLRPVYNPTARPQPIAERAQISSGGFDTKGWFRGSETAAPGDRTLQAIDENDSAALPVGFDEQAFIAGARIAYRDLQKAWDANDLAAIEALTTASMFTQIQDRIKSLEANNRTEILKLDTELLEVREVDGMLEAVVLFDAVMREDAKAQARQVREVWHFTKPATSQQPKWYLDGIQQLED